MTASEKKQLMANACKVRMGVIESTYGAKSGHPGGSLSASDLFTYLYFREMKVDPADPKWEERDRFVLSKGHTAPGLYAALALKGFFPWEELKTLRRSQRVFLPTRPQADCDRDYRLWKRAVSRASDWIEH